VSATLAAGDRGRRGAVGGGRGAVRAHHAVVGRRPLTPPDPQLKAAWYPGGFNPCAYHVKIRFQSLLSKRNLHRYAVGQADAVAALVQGGAVHGIK
jgi:hypothetical protein